MTEVSFFELVYWHWFVLAAVLGVIEILAPGVFFLWLAIAAVITGSLALIIPGIGAAGQIILFSILSMVLVYVGWKYVKKAAVTSDQPLLNQRNAQHVGKLYTLSDKIENGTGRITIGDSSWKVEGPDLAAGTQVRVTGFDGAVLQVEKA